MNNKRSFIGITLFALLLTMVVFKSAEAQDAKVNWLTIEEAEALNKKEPRKIFVDFYTDWCGWCKRIAASAVTGLKTACIRR